ncbi:hypothetical protein COV86_04335, partial [Candidatus Roizmanbacteria bacterium CG11_big_fil_rev_8_21_14_0_20_35_14]
IFLGLLLIILFFKYRLEPLKEVWKKYKVIFVFILILFTSLLIGFSQYTLFENAVGSLYLIRLLLYLGYWGYLGYWIKKSPGSKKTIKTSLNIFVVLTVITTITQYLLYPDLRNLFYQGWDPHL